MPVSYALHDHVAILTFDDGKANVYSHQALSALTAGLDQAEADPGAHALLLVGRPGRFSAGFDLATMNAGPQDMRRLVKAGAHFVTRLVLAPMPVVAACTGHALAAGALVLLAADHRVGVEGDWKIGLNEVSIGMTLPVWAVELARYRLAPSEFDWAVVLGQTGNPQQARSAGFLDRVVAPEDLLGEATAAAVALSTLRGAAVEGTKSRARGELVRRMLDDLDGDLERLSGPAPEQA